MSIDGRPVRRALLVVVFVVVVGLLLLDGALAVPGCETDRCAWDEGSDGSFTQFLELSHKTSAVPHGPKTIKGGIKLNGIFYQTQCRCVNPDAQSSCGAPVRLRLHQEEFNRHLGLSKPDLRNLLGLPQNIMLVHTEHASFSDVDPRETHVTLGTPGGDFGEFVVALGTYESMMNQPLTEASIFKLLSGWLGTIQGSMYFSTDEEAIDHLQRNLIIDGQKGNVVNLRLDLTPPANYREPLLADIVKPANQGSYFLKAMLTDPGKFYIRREVVEAAVRSLHKIVWDRATLGSDGVALFRKVNFQVLSGTYQPTAWINFRSNPHCEEENKAPAFAPKSHRGFGAVQVFVNHPVAVRSLRRLLARFFVGVDPHPDTTVAQFAARLDRAGRNSLEIASEILGASIPFYTVVVE